MNTTYFCLSILFVIFAQGSGILSEENNINAETSDLLIRKKRIIDKTVGGNLPVSIEVVPYIVNIRLNGFPTCGGAILSSIYVITAAHCLMEKGIYTVLSGSHLRHRGTPHGVINIIIYPHFDPQDFPNDLALLHISPPINFVLSPNRPIELFNGHIPPHSHATFSGWGCNHHRGELREFPNELRSITLPVISEDDCYNIYARYTIISRKEVCTLDRAGLKGSCYGDSGGPLVFRGRLVGVMAWNEKPSDPRFPIVYTNLSRPEYRDWVTSIVHRVWN